MREDGETSIPGPWSEQSLERPAASTQPDMVARNLPTDWEKARQRVELYLEALCVSDQLRPILTDRAMALALNKLSADDSFIGVAMSALYDILEKYRNGDDLSVPAGRGPSDFPLTHQRAMVPDSRSIPKMERGHMIPAIPSNHSGARPTNHEKPTSGAMPWRFYFPPGLEQYFF